MSYTVLTGDCLETMRGLADRSVHCCVTSPPYFGLRDYGHEGQIGLEETPEAYVAKLVEVFAGVRRVLRDDGTLWLNIGDSYGGYFGDKYAHRPFGNDRTADASTPPNKRSMGSMQKQLLGIPWRLAFALQADGWMLRQDIIWHKPNPMPESVTDRCTKAHEYLFLLSKSLRYYFNGDAMQEPAVYDGPPRRAESFMRKTATTPPPGQPNQHRPDREDIAYTGTRNKRSVWTVATWPYPGAHFATFPPKLIEPCILAGCPVGGTVLDPFAGSGTTGQVAIEHGREAILCELSPTYVDLIHKRLASVQLRIVA